MSFHVRRAAPADAPTVAEFNRRLAIETEDKVLDPQVLSAGVASVLSDSAKGRYFVAEENGDIIGQLMITYEWSDWRNGWIWWLQSVYVREDRRRDGVFKAVFDFAVDEAQREGGVVMIRLYVERANKRAQETYRRLGFDEMHFHLFERTL